MRPKQSPTDCGFAVYQVDDIRYFEKTDLSKRQLMVCGWVLYRERQEDRLRITVHSENITSLSVNTREELAKRSDVADMYDAKNPWIGFRIFLETAEDLSGIGPEISITVSRDTGRDEITVLTLPVADLPLYREDHVHYMIDQFALNGNVIRMAGWGYLSELFEEYRPLTVWAEDLGGTVIARAEYMIRPDIVALFKSEGDKDRKWGFFLLLDLSDTAAAKICFGEEGLFEEKTYVLEDLKREKREKRRRYRNRLDMIRHADPMQKEDDRWYREHLSAEDVRALIRKRLDPENVDYDVWIRRQALTEREKEKQRQTVFEKMPMISIAVPAYRTPERFLREMIESVRKQTYSKWELCIADGSLDGSITEILKEYANADLRIRVKTLDQNYGISGNTNQAILLGDGDYLTLLDHDDVLTEDALFEMVKCINETDADCLYSDEDKSDFEMEDFFEPHFKPDYNPDMLFSCNYICHLFMVKKEVVQKAGPFRPEYDGSQDFDFILRCVRNSKTVSHVKKVLYHWRSHLNSTAMNPENKMYCYVAGRKAILSDLKAGGFEGAEVRNYTRLGYYEPVFPLRGKPSVTIVTTEESAKILETERKTGRLYGNSQILTYANKNLAEGEYMLFLNGRYLCGTKVWVERLLSICSRPEVGIAGGLVYNELGRVSSSGKVIMKDGRIRDLFRGLLKEEPGYAAHALMQQDVSAVSDRCLMVKRSLYDKFGGFKRGMKEAAVFQAAVREDGYLVVYTPFVQIKEKESPKEEDIRVEELAKNTTDPFYHPAFDPEGELFTLSL